MNQQPMSVALVEQGYQRHAALAQLHRWYQFYELPEASLANQLDILQNDIRLNSGLGEAQGHAAYEERVAQLPASWENAHFVRNPQVKVEGDTVFLEADVTYLNRGVNEDGGVRSAELHYRTELTSTPQLLPRFSTITIEQLSESEADEFKPAYAENRLLSLIHYYLAIIEDPARNPEPMRELFAEDFTLNFSSGAITDMAGFEAWLAGPGSQVRASTHELSNFSFESLGGNRYRLGVDFGWQGILPDDTEMSAKTRHTWTVADTPAERFARIETVDVEVLEPFAPLTR